MTADELQLRILESLELIGDYVDILELRQRGNIVAQPGVVLNALMELRNLQQVKQLSGARWGLWDWPRPKTLREEIPPTRRQVPQTQEPVRDPRTGRFAPRDGTETAKSLRSRQRRQSQKSRCTVAPNPTKCRRTPLRRSHGDHIGHLLWITLWISMKLTPDEEKGTDAVMVQNDPAAHGLDSDFDAALRAPGHAGIGTASTRIASA